MESAPENSPREELVRIRRRALIEFEISRSPDAPNRTIAQACRTSTGAVAAVRERSLELPAEHSESDAAATAEGGRG